MANIPDFTAEAFDDPMELRKQLSRALKELAQDVSKPVDIYIGKNVVIGWVDDGKTPLPQGYEVANGQRGTFDAPNSRIIQIQRVK